MKVRLPHIIKLHAGIGGFAEDKDEAKKIRVENILPALEEKKRIVLDFSEVKYSTQSFVHALLGEALQRFGESALDRLEFRSCTPQLRSLVQLVADYSLGGFRTDLPAVEDINGKTVKKAKREQGVKKRRRSA